MVAPEGPSLSTTPVMAHSSLHTQGTGKLEPLHTRAEVRLYSLPVWKGLDARPEDGALPMGLTSLARAGASTTGHSTELPKTGVFKGMLGAVVIRCSKPCGEEVGCREVPGLQDRALGSRSE